MVGDGGPNPIIIVTTLSARPNPTNRRLVESLAPIIMLLAAMTATAANHPPRSHDRENRFNIISSLLGPFVV